MSLARVLRIREVPIFAAFVVLLVVTIILNPATVSSDGISSILTEAALIGFLAAGQTNLIIMRHIDLSIGSTAGLSSFLVGNYAMNNGGVSPLIAIGIAVALDEGLIVPVIRHADEKSLVEIAKADTIYREAKHPYTRALLSAVPMPDISRKKERIVLEGDVPSPVNPPSGCRFHTRCAQADAVCSPRSPQLQAPAGLHKVSCLMFEPDSAHPQAAQWKDAA